MPVVILGAVTSTTTVPFVVNAPSTSWTPALVIALVVGAATLLLAVNQQRVVAGQMILQRIDRFFDSEFFTRRRKEAARSVLDGAPDLGAIRDVLNGIEDIAIARDLSLFGYGVIHASVGWWIVHYCEAYSSQIAEIRRLAGDPWIWDGIAKLAKRLRRGSYVFENQGYRTTETSLRKLLEDDADLWTGR